MKRFHWLSLYWGDAHVCTSRKSGQCYFLQWCEPEGGLDHLWVRRSGEGGGGVWVFLLIVWYQYSCINKIVYYHSTFWFCSWGRPGGRGGGSAGWFRSNFRPPCQKLLDPVLFLFVANRILWLRNFNEMTSQYFYSCLIKSFICRQDELKKLQNENERYERQDSEICYSILHYLIEVSSIDQSQYLSDLPPTPPLVQH